MPLFVEERAVCALVISLKARTASIALASDMSPPEALMLNPSTLLPIHRKVMSNRMERTMTNFLPRIEWAELIAICRTKL